MKKKRFFVLVTITLLVSAVLAGVLAAAELPAAGTQGQETDEYLLVVSEETGMEARYTAVRESCTFDGKYEVYLCRPEAPAVLPVRDTAQKQEALRLLGTTGLILSPDSTNDRIMAFNPATGDLVDPNFVPADPDNMVTPREVILSASGNSLLVSDQASDVVHEYDLLGNYVGVFAPAGGPDPNIMDNMRGIALRPNGNLLVTVGAGANANTVVEFDTGGNYLGTFVTAGSGGLASPFDVFERPSGWLVGGITSDAVHVYSLTTGAYISDLAAIDSFPQQIAQASNNNVLVANFFGAQEGIVEFTPAGAVVDVYHPADEYRGVYELPNSNFLAAASGGVFEISRAGSIVSTKYTGEGGQYLTFVSIPFPLIVGEKSAAESVFVGDNLTYTISISNSGTDATGVVMTDVLPAGTTYISGTLSCQGAAGVCSFDSPNNQITWNGDIDNGEGLIITYEVDTDNVPCGGLISNEAVFSNAAMPFDAVLGHDAFAYTEQTTYNFEADDGGFVANTPPGEWAWGMLVPSPDSPTTTISGANLWATNLDGNITVEPSEHYLTKTLTLGNGPLQIAWWDWWHGDGFDVGSVRIDGAEVYSVTRNQTEWVYQSLDATPWQNQTVDLSFFYEGVGGGTGGAGWYIDDVRVLGCESPADFSTSTKEAPAAAESGSQFMYTIEIANTGDSDAVGATMVDPIPAGLSYVNGSVTGGAAYNAGMNQIEWAGDVGANSTVTITFMVDVTAESGMVTNTATIDHASTTAVQVSATTNILMVEEEFEIYMPVVLKP